MNEEDFLKTLKSSIKDAIDRYYRNLVYIEKKDYLSDLINVLKAYLEVNSNPKVAYAFHPWVSESKERMLKIKEIFSNFEDIDYSSSDKYLGNTYDIVILDLVDNFQPNYIGRLVDLVRGGGLIVLYTNNLVENKLFKNTIVRNGKVDSLYEERFKKKIFEHEGTFIINEEGYFAKPFSGNLGKRTNSVIPKNPYMPIELHKLSLSADQNQVIEGFEFLLRGGKRILALTASRGRGKSAVTGLSLAGIIYKNLEDNFKSRIAVTAPSISSCSQIMEFLKKGLDALGIKNKVIKSDNGFIRAIDGNDFRVYYEPPEATLTDQGNILVIDEAAALGINYIDLATKIWRKVVLVTTIYGYEGSGKVFLKYLRNMLSSRKLSVRWLTMEKPLRYAEGDPIEDWLYNALMLNAEVSKPLNNINIAYFETLNKENLINSDNILSQVYGILVTAHYRNNPDDLMIMLDGVHHHLKSIYYDDSYIAVAQVSEEGELSDPMIEYALKGGTFDGDLIPDRMLKHVRVKEFGKMKGWRIVRIAVIPELQDKGIGSKMLLVLSKEAEEEGIDWIGSSFMGDPKVLNFWIKNNFYPIHVSPKRNEKFGDFPVVVIKPFSEEAKKIVNISSYIFKEKLLNTLHDVYYDMSPNLASILLHGSRFHKDVNLTKIHLAKISAFLQGTSPYESSADAIHLLVLKYFWDSKRNWSLENEEEQVLIGKILQGKPWGYLSSTLGINRTHMNEIIYGSISDLSKKYYNLDADSSLGVSLEELSDEFR